MDSKHEMYPAHSSADRTSLTDDERIKNIVPLPPPENLIRFFPIQGTAVESLIAEFRYLDEPGWTPVRGVKEVAAGYQLIVDNLMDLTHIPFLHPNTLGNQGGAQAAEAQTQTTVRGNRVAVERVVRDSEPAPLFRRVKALEGNVDRHQFSEFVPPCYVLIELKVMPAGTQDLDRGIEWRVFHIVTPVDAGHTRYHWAVVRHFAPGDEAVSRALSQLSPDYQQVLTLRFISGLSHAETGRVLKRSEEAVRVLQHRALSTLRKLLDKERETR